jgi:hypothetical protein
MEVRDTNGVRTNHTLGIAMSLTLTMQ